MPSIVPSFNFLWSGLGIFDCNVLPGVGKFFSFERNDLPVGRELDIRTFEKYHILNPPTYSRSLPRAVVIFEKTCSNSSRLRLKKVEALRKESSNAKQRRD